MAARRPFWKWCRWKSIGFCLWPPSTCLWNLKFQSKLDLCSGNHVVYRRTDKVNPVYHPPTSLGGGIISTDGHFPRQWNEYVKHASVLNRSLEIPQMQQDDSLECNLGTRASAWLRQWLVACPHRANIWTNVDFSLIRFHGICLRAISPRLPYLLQGVILLTW